ncbi:hypothetical protein ACNJUT_21215, partial [Mycobacterium tuberculosis]
MSSIRFDVRHVLAAALFLAGAAAASRTVAAETAGAAGDAGIASDQTIIVTAKREESIGTIVSASAGIVGGVELSQRPVLRPGELLEAVPGMIATAH